MNSNHYYKSIVIMGGGGGGGGGGVWGHGPQEPKLLTFLWGKLLNWTKLGIILKNKGLFRNLTLFECFFRNFREA